MSSFGLFPTFAITAFDPIYVKNAQSKSFLLDSGVLPCPGGVEVLCCWLRNDHPTDNLVFWKFWSSYNGGNLASAAGGSTSITFRGRGNIPEPTGQFTVKQIIPLNFATFPTPPITAYVWDGDLTIPGGMVGPKGEVASTDFHQAGTEFYDVGLIIPPGGAGGCSCLAQELGECSEQFLMSIVPPNQL